MKKILMNICLAVSVLSFSGCSDFLDRESYGRDTSWKTDEDVMKAVYALYYFVSPNWSEQICGRGHMWFECASDNILIGRDRPAVDEIREFRMSPSNDQDVQEVWGVMYQNVAKANNIIKLVPDLGITPSVKKLALGSAYFFRGFSMLWMVPYYGDDTNGGIPIILDTTPMDAMDSPRPDHVLKNYDQIIQDFRDAAEELPYFSELSADQYGLPHKAAAWAFAARAALYAAQYDQSYYDIVIEMCDKVMSLTGADKRSLYIDPSDKSKSFANLWRKEQNHSSEYIFSLEGDVTNGARYHGVTFVNAGWGLYNTWGYYTPSKELWDAFEEGDQRREATILYPGNHVRFMGRDITFGGYCTDGSITSYTTSHVSAGLINQKFISPWETGSYSEVSNQRDKLWNTLNCCLMRYADVMLMKAEALIWTKGEGDAEAKNLLDDIRERAGLPRDSRATKAQLQNERRCELAFEFQPSRHIDVVRWGLAEEYYSKPLHSVVSKMVDGRIETEEVEVYPGRTFNPTYNKVFPIPQTAFNGTVNLTQNKGY
ncbi:MULTISPECIES: RagB/SusD family nutrient uptake outer membrane protein [Alistipes]|nr:MULTISPECIES: RagB/SusD family nutrient uptake outer membrane protein [Alistipes]MBQ4903801.1 RagB/SusD family nutrient uptake outer membrane protein [Alistipes sp. Marseille-P2263]MCI2258083.1 RagB/SusD family nutrient uptake outer membrane protein [Alistipes dispar]